MHFVNGVLRSIQLFLLFSVTSEFLVGNKLVETAIDTPAIDPIETEITPIDPKIIEGATLVLTCTVLTGGYDSSSLYFQITGSIPAVIIPDTYYTILSPTIMQLTYPNMTRNDSGTYICYVNGTDAPQPFRSVEVSVGQPPAPITNVSFVSDNFENLTINWCPSVIQPDMVTYTLYWKSTIIGGYNRCSAVEVRQCWKCTLHARPSYETESVYYPTTHFFFINATNEFGTSISSSFAENPQLRMKPSPVSNLLQDKTQTTNTSVVISWDCPKSLDYLSEDELIYRLSYQSEWNNQSIMVDVGSNRSAVLTNLTGYTNYTIRVECKPTVEGYWGDATQIQAATLEGVPSVGPEIPFGWFRLGEAVDCPCHSVTLFWKSIPTEMRNGIILGYNLVSSDESKFISGVNNLSGSVVIQDHQNEEVGVQAVTSVGSSPLQYAQFPINFDELPSPSNFCAESTPDSSGVVLSWTAQDGIDNYTIFYCQRLSTNKGTACDNEANAATVAGSTSNYTLSLPDYSYYLFSIAAITAQGTSGLGPALLCVYDYNEPPTAPVLDSVKNTDTSITVLWSPPVCLDKTGKVIDYLLSYFDTVTQKWIMQNTTVDVGISEYIISDLMPSRQYSATVLARSRTAFAPSTPKIYETIASPSESNVGYIVGITVAVIAAILLIILIPFFVGRCYCRRAYGKEKIVVPNPTNQPDGIDVSKKKNTPIYETATPIHIERTSTADESEFEKTHHQGINLRSSTDGLTDIQLSINSSDKDRSNSSSNSTTTTGTSSEDEDCYQIVAIHSLDSGITSLEHPLNNCDKSSTNTNSVDHQKVAFDSPDSGITTWEHPLNNYDKSLTNTNPADHQVIIDVEHPTVSGSSCGDSSCLSYQPVEYKSTQPLDDLSDSTAKTLQVKICDESSSPYHEGPVFDNDVCVNQPVGLLFVNSSSTTPSVDNNTSSRSTDSYSKVTPLMRM